MQKKGRVLLKSSSTKIVAVIAAFAIAVSAVMFVFGWALIYSYQKQITLQSLRSGFEQVSQNVLRDITDITDLGNWCSASDSPPARFLTMEYNRVTSLEMCTLISNELKSNRSGRYVERLLISGIQNPKRIIQLGYNTNDCNVAFLDGAGGISLLPEQEPGETIGIIGITSDPFSQRNRKTLCLESLVRSPDLTGFSGVLYLSVNTDIISDNLSSLILLPNTNLYIATGDLAYKFTNGKIDTSNTFAPSDIYRRGKKEVATFVFDITGDLSLVLECGKIEVRTSIRSWLFLILIVVCFIIMLALASIAIMEATISRPIYRIRRKISEIALGNFSYSPEIEGNGEIGEVGAGINELARSVLSLMDARLADEKQKHDLEYRMLQRQVSPHFLYNALDTIKWMAVLQKADGIAEMTSALSRLLRTVSKDTRTLVPLREELELLDNYYTIMEYRYGRAITYEKCIEDEILLDCKVPRFILQPLMENAIFHGIEPKGCGCIKLEASKHGESAATISLTDDGIGIPSDDIEKINSGRYTQEQPSDPVGIGLSSVHRRIVNIFGADYGLECESVQGQYTKFSLIIPFTR